jgi:hypothetical protein
LPNSVAIESHDIDRLGIPLWSLFKNTSVNR